MKKPNPTQFYVGLVLALGSAAWTFFGSFHPSHTIVKPYFQFLQILEEVYVLSKSSSRKENSNQ